MEIIWGRKNNAGGGKQMKKVKSKIVGIILTLTMVIGLMPQINTFAEGKTYSVYFSEAKTIEGNTATYQVEEVDVTLTSSQNISAEKKQCLETMMS